MKGNNRQRAALPPATSFTGERKREADTFSPRNAKRSRLPFLPLLDNVSTP